MSNKRVFVFFLVFLSWILSVNGATVSQTSCPFPPELKSNYDYNWKSRKNEWRNTKSPIDYLILSLSWTPTFCASLQDEVRDKEFQCHRQNSFGFIVHGLWPQTFEALSVRDQPRNCRNEQQLPYSIIKRFYCIMPDEDLMQAEWEKHGSCYYLTAIDYFTAMEDLFNQLNLPDIRSITNATFSSIKDKFLSLNSPDLFASAVYVSMVNKHQLKEIRICYNLQHEFIDCRQ